MDEESKLLLKRGFWLIVGLGAGTITVFIVWSALTYAYMKFWTNESAKMVHDMQSKMLKVQPVQVQQQWRALTPERNPLAVTEKIHVNGLPTEDCLQQTNQIINDDFMRCRKGYDTTISKLSN